MKPTTTVIIILYLAVFGLIGYFLYQKYYHNTVTPFQNENTITITPDKTIFYTAGKDFYQLNSDLQTRGSKDTSTYKIQSTGEVKAMTIDKDNQYFYYQTITAINTSEIWQVNLKDYSFEKLFSNQTPGLENFISFRNPKISPDAKNLAFIASHQGSDQIFNFEITSRNLTNLSYESFQGNISDFDWASTGSTIYYTGKQNDKTVLKSLQLDRVSRNIWEGSQKIDKISATKNKLIVFFSDLQTANIGYLELGNPDKINKITDIVAPNKVTNYNLDLKNEKIAYQVYDSTLNKNDLYLVNIDGTNLLQITEDGKSELPVFSPDGQQIAFWLKDSGIYTINTDKKNGQKVLNDEGKIDNILIWN